MSYAESGAIGGTMAAFVVLFTFVFTPVYRWVFKVLRIRYKNEHFPGLCAIWSAIAICIFRLVLGLY